MTEIRWNQWPKTPLPETEFSELYLVTVVSGCGKPYVRMAYARKDFDIYRSEFKVLAWAKMPEPYKP